MAERLARVNQLDVKGWMSQRVEELQSLRYKQLDLTIEMQAVYWNVSHGVNIVEMLLSWAMDRNRSLKVILPVTGHGGPIETGRFRGEHNIPFLQSLESLIWIGNIR
jgi:hypothetical protein